MHNSIDGRLWISKEKQNFLGKGRVELLEHIHSTGSISAAAKVMKMSYKAAWDAIDAINKLSEEPLLERSTGGKGGGGTKLTPAALAYITMYKEMEQAQSLFLEAIEHFADDPKKLSAFISKLTLRTSARNQLLGKVSHIDQSDTQVKVTIELEKAIFVVVKITSQSLQEMDIQTGNAIYILLKAGWISLFSQEPAKEEDKNILEGNINAINENQTYSEVSVSIGESLTLIVSVPTEELIMKKLHLKERVWAVFDTSNALLAV